MIGHRRQERLRLFAYSRLVLGEANQANRQNVCLSLVRSHANGRPQNELKPALASRERILVEYCYAESSMLLH